MRIQFCCPACHQPVSADIRHVGKSVPCPACKENLTIPEESRQEESSLRAAGTTEILPQLVQAGDGQWVQTPSSYQEEADLLSMSSGPRRRPRGVVKRGGPEPGARGGRRAAHVDVGMAVLIGIL